MKYEPFKFITLLFVGVICLASILLYLPFTHINGTSISFIDSIFTATSALCVTGLNTIDFVNTFNVLGLIIIALLIQLGGLGIICTAIIIFITLGKKVNLRFRLLIKNSFNLSSMKGIVNFALRVFKITFVIEFVGTLLLFLNIRLLDKNIIKSIGISVFHSISAFNNAGFDLLNLNGLFNDYTKVITMILIVLGGIGFLVISEVLTKGLKSLTLQTKIILSTTIVLLLVGVVGYLLVADLSLIDSAFLSVSTRTAGFVYWDLSKISNAGYLLTVFLMFVGASPTSTGGGIKTITFFVLMLSIYSICRRKDCEIFKRRISGDVINKSLVILLNAIIIIFSATFLIAYFDPFLTLKDIFFEVVSAYATVGLSLGITSQLSILSKVVLCVVMFIGRVGSLTLISIWLKEDQKKIKYPVENIVVG